MALEATPTELHEDLFQFMQRTNRVDRLEFDVASALDHVTWAAAQRPASMPGALYFDNVLNARIEYEHLEPWRFHIGSLLGDLRAANPLQTAENVNRYLTDNLTPSGTGRGRATRMNPLQVLTAHGGSPTELAIATVGILRTLGVAAKKSTARSTVEVHDGEHWFVFEPLTPGSMKRIAEAAEQESTGGENLELPVKLRLRFTEGGAALTDWDRIVRLFDISRFENGGWNPMRSFEGGPEGDDYVLTLAADEYLVSAGVRNGNGDPYVQTWVIEPEPGAELSLTLPLDLPDDAGVFQFTKVRELSALPELKLPGDGGERSLEKVVASQPVLLFFFRLDSEPSVRMLRILNELAPELKSLGIEVACVELPSEGGLPLGEALEGQPLAMLHVSDPEPGARSTWTLPSVLLLDKGGSPISWTEGYNLNIATLLLDAARQVH